MPPRATVEEAFDDDTDLPLPSRYLPNTGSRGAVLEEINIEQQPSSAFPDTDNPVRSNARPSQSQSHSQSQAVAEPKRNPNVVTDITPFKKWTSIYPIYMDAKRRYGDERRIAREKSLWWPLSKDIAQACLAIGIQCLHEPNKCHPRDWENPGRVKVLWKKDGRFVFAKAQTRKQLIEMLAVAVQAARPNLKPSPAIEKPTSTSSITQGGPSKPSAKKTRRAKRKPRLPSPPKPLPALPARLSPYSPVIESGVLIETVKAGMNAPGGQVPGIEGNIPPGGSSKGKRKVVRVRG